MAAHFAVNRSRSSMRGLGIGLSWLCLAMLLTGCQGLRPQAIVPERYNLPPQLLRDNEAAIERGKPRPVIDGIGWVFGIPNKLLLWNRRVENHRISPETEAYLATYLAENRLDEIKVRLNQYRPGDDWRRLTRNRSVAWPWRYTFGTLTVLGETLIPGRIFGGDHYNPYTGTIHLYSDVPAIAFHEAAHAKDFSRRKYPGTYAAAYFVPFVPLWHESVATNDVLAYVDYLEDPELRREAYYVLYPAYGTYVGNALGTLIPDYSTPIYLAAVISGHIIGRTEADLAPSR